MERPHHYTMGWALVLPHTTIPPPAAPERNKRTKTYSQTPPCSAAGGYPRKGRHLTSSRRRYLSVLQSLARPTHAFMSCPACVVGAGPYGKRQLQNQKKIHSVRMQTDAVTSHHLVRSPRNVTYSSTTPVSVDRLPP